MVVTSLRRSRLSFETLRRVRALDLLLGEIPGLVSLVALLNSDIRWVLSTHIYQI